MIPGGYDLVVKLMAKEPNPLKIKLNSPVAQINRRTSQSPVEIVTSKGEKITCDHVIVTVPLGILKANVIKFNPTLSIEHINAIDRIGKQNSH